MEKLNIPVLDLSPEIDALWDELQAAIQGVLRSGQFIAGPNVKAFEQEAAAYLGVRHAVALNSGTDALFIALRSLGIGPGDEVITVPFTFFATAEAVSHVGATPVFVDIDPRTFALDVEQLTAAVTPRTRAIIPVHLFGHPAEMETLLNVAETHRLEVIEDVAQAFGAQYRGKKTGTMGRVNAFSFFPTKNLGAYGDGGLLTTNDDKIAEVARMLRAHGSKVKYHNEIVGYNSRLDEIQAAILRVKLPHIDEWNDQRRRVAAVYTELLRDVPGIRIPSEAEGCKHVYHQYTIRAGNGRRQELKERLGEAGIGTMVYYPTPVHQLPVYRDLGYHLPAAEQAASEVLSLPIWPQMQEALQRQIAEQIRSILR